MICPALGMKSYKMCNFNIYPVNKPRILSFRKESLEIVSQSYADDGVASRQTKHWIQLQEVPDRDNAKIRKV